MAKKKNEKKNQKTIHSCFHLFMDYFLPPNKHVHIFRFDNANK